MTHTQQMVLAKIITRSATRDDFLSVSNTYFGWKKFLSQDQAQGPLAKFNIRIYISPSLIRIFFQEGGGYNLWAGNDSIVIKYNGTDLN
jgi:hypothetical protein